MLDGNVAMLEFFISEPFDNRVKIAFILTKKNSLLLVMLAYYLFHGNGMGHDRLSGPLQRS